MVQKEAKAGEEGGLLASSRARLGDLTYKKMWHELKICDDETVRK
jgi:hypothetical protein